jgi:hypothetical protein
MKKKSRKFEEKWTRILELLATDPHHPSLRLMQHHGIRAGWEIRLTDGDRALLAMQGDGSAKIIGIGNNIYRH